MHLAAESHVDRSILGPELFVRTNVLGHPGAARGRRRHKVKRFLMVSTDEVYGSLGPDRARSPRRRRSSPPARTRPPRPRADLVALAYHHTFGMDVVVTRCSNNYGPYQFPEKLIPLMVVNALHDKPLPVYGDGGNVRDWLHVEDHCRALLAALEKGKAGEVYNIGGGAEQREHRPRARMLLGLLGKPRVASSSYVKDRPGHDRRYAIDPTKIRTELGWTPAPHLRAGARRRRSAGTWTTGLVGARDERRLPRSTTRPQYRGRLGS